ncbi:calcium-binding protein [Microvirga vignae]|uniref:calcium-binding protein n=1 Tax=Microvirga vignae TaxID=1225564 RepID=UPI000A914414|nr:calcium-binding protein [Microvirga vignae]
MAEQLKYIFYGGVEGIYQNSDLNNLSYLDPALGAAAFGYKEGQLIKGYLSFTGAALQIIQDNLPPQPNTAIEVPIGTPGLDFFLPQPRVGDYTEADLVGIDDPIRDVIQIQFTGSPDDPLAQLGLRLSGGPDGPGASMDINGAFFADDDDAQARADGIWLPEHIVPDYKTGTSGDNVLSGNKAYNFLSGGSGDDLLRINTGRGWAWGGNGNDTIVGSDGGGAGLFQGDNLHGGAGADRIRGGAGGDLIEGGGNADHLRGDEGRDIIGGGVGNDTVRGGSGDDFVSGQSGTDWVYGDSGNDQIEGGSGSDYLFGGNGNDFVWGGTGNDKMRGGSGSDLFLFNTGNDGRDVIYDFQSGIDKIRIAPPDPITFDQLIATAIVDDGDVTLTYAFNATITFDNLQLSALKASDFDIV